MILKKTRLFRWFSSNSQVEATSASLNGWSNKTLDIPIFIITYLWTIFPYLIFVRTILRCVAAPTLNEGERSPFCSAVVVGTQWFIIDKTRQINVSRIFPCKFQKININSVFGHCTHLTFKICQIIASISLSGQFNDFLKSYFLAGFCYLAQMWGTRHYTRLFYRLFQILKVSSGEDGESTEGDGKG